MASSGEGEEVTIESLGVTTERSKGGQQYTGTHILDRAAFGVGSAMMCVFRVI
jgi:hypothetical protein